MSAIQRLLKIVFQSSKWKYLLQEKFLNTHERTKRVSNKNTSQQMKDKLPIEQQLQKKISKIQNEPAPLQKKIAPTSLLVEATQKSLLDKSSSNKYLNQEAERVKKWQFQRQRTPKVIRIFKKSFNFINQQFRDEINIQGSHPEKEQEPSHTGIVEPTADFPKNALQSQGLLDQQQKNEQPAKSSNQLSEEQFPFSANKIITVADIFVKARQRSLKISVPDESLEQQLKNQVRVKREFVRQDKYDGEKIKTDVKFRKQRRAKQSVENKTLCEPSSVTAKLQSMNDLENKQLIKQKESSKKQSLPLKVNKDINENKTVMYGIGQQNRVLSQKESEKFEAVAFSSYPKRKVESLSEGINKAKRAKDESVQRNQNANDFGELQNPSNDTNVRADIIEKSVKDGSTVQPVQQIPNRYLVMQSSSSHKPSITNKIKVNVQENQERLTPKVTKIRNQSNSIIAAKPQEDSKLTQIHIIAPQEQSTARNIQVEVLSQNESITDKNESENLLCSQGQLIRDEAVTSMIKERKVSVVGSLMKTRKGLIGRQARITRDQPFRDRSSLVPDQQFYERQEEIRKGDCKIVLNAQIIRTQDLYIEGAEPNDFSEKVFDQQEAVIHKTKNDSNRILLRKQTSSPRVHSYRKIFNKVALQTPKEQISLKSKFKCWSNQPQKEIELNEQDEYFRFSQELQMEESESFDDFSITRQSKRTKTDLIKESITRKYKDEQQKRWQLQIKIRANWKSDEEMTIKQSIERPLEVTRIKQGFSGFTTMTGWTARVTHFPSDWSIGMLEDILDPSKTAIRQIKTKKHYFSAEQGDVFIDFNSASCMANSLQDCSINFKSVNSNLYRIILHHLEITHGNGSSNQIRKGVQINFSDTTLDAQQLESLASGYGQVLQIIEEFTEHELIAVFYFETSTAALSFQSAMNKTLFGQQVLKAKFTDTSLEELSKLTFKEDDEDEKQISDQE